MCMWSNWWAWKIQLLFRIFSYLDHDSVILVLCSVYLISIKQKVNKFRGKFRLWSVVPWCCSVVASQQLCDHAVVASPRRNETDIGQNCFRLGSQAELFPMLVVGSHLGSIWNHQLSEFEYFLCIFRLYMQWKCV